MFDATYLGHQGWLIESAGTRVLADPLLDQRLTGTLGDPIEIYPPRNIDLGSFPAIDAVVVSHEHPDHLNVPTLLRLDRSIPILLPARASVAARGLLRELGFTTSLLESGQPVTIGALEVHPFHTREITRDEWDVVPFLVRDRAGNGSFATSIDAPESVDFARFAGERAGQVGLWASSHNAMDLFFLDDGGRQGKDEQITAELARDFEARFLEQFRSAPQPEALLVLSSGFSFVGDLGWMNRHVFPGRADRLVGRLAARLPGVTVRAPLPGHRFSMSGGRLVDEVHARPFFSTRDPDEWPPHAAEPFEGELPDYAPASGIHRLEERELGALFVALEGFAGHLYGSELMRSLYASGDASVAFCLRNGDERLGATYRPDACAFERAAGDARATATAGLECWASDLLAVLRLEIVAGYITLGRCRTWNHAPERLRCDLAAEMSLYTHPLRLPARALEQYLQSVAELSAQIGPERIAAGGARA